MTGPSKASDSERPADVRSADSVEAALLKARELIVSTVNLHRRTARNSVITLDRDEAAVANAVDVLIGQAKHSVSVALPDGGERAKVVGAAMERLAVGGRKRIPARLLCTPESLRESAVRAAVERGEAQVQVRVAEALADTLIVDGRIAMVRSRVESRGEEVVSVIEDPALVRTLDLLFAGAWGSAVPLAEHEWIDKWLRSESVRRILERLCQGYTDDVAAREVEVSLRTYRRHVAEIMRGLGASSRFQAGVRAVELGLLPAGD
ncbi:hypothetical protein PS467_19135 [Streptomyces luomodiensis]|uniref:HTH luxR-type domain-containing protein n=1 Tax=Streptomyces luomodiensis TaxID=3026192 RepID=A0ABY9UXJ9_9ACTN|nr:hypothetical protein [Streptomyces sp. SCA4-21]WNE97295.1 hypothetical protein PS467_19135 [Streptomyces sp. SCA4-21]